MNKVNFIREKYEKETISVVGLEYIGLPTAALLSNRGYQVYGVDVVQNVVDTINKGQIHIVEPELDIYVKAAVNTRRLVADTKPKEADVFIIAVPTPFHEGYIPNIDYVISATKSIVPYVREGNVVILESTSPVGTTEKIEEILRTSGIDTTKIYIAHCPERVLPGKIMKELVENDRIVGGLTPEATKVVAEFYREFVQD
ncbi:MAG TPA: NAD(P)-binding domain-containing protein [Ignavibacteriales bacterium]|nr:NAD(P)-binding domain-containing protein [Ignavibacteriales bacterium]